MAGAIGMDIHPFDGVDVVADLDGEGWPFRGDAFDEIQASHVIEHVEDVIGFLREMHRVGRPGALVHVITPHFTSLTSWGDPTHRRHLSVLWYEALGDYLGDRVGRFSLVSSRVTFVTVLSSLVPRAVIGLLGYKQWEKHWAFMFPGRDVVTTLRIEK